MRDRIDAAERYMNQSEHPQRLVGGGFDQMYVHLVLQPESLQAFCTLVQIIDDGLTEAFDHEVLSAP